MEAISALRPVTIPPGSLPPGWEELARLKGELQQLKVELDGYWKLDTKLSTITDEPVWDANIPFGPLAYFKGQLVHTNDLTYTPPATLADHAPAPPQLKSAKQARAIVAEHTAAAQKKVHDLEAQISAKEESLQKDKGGSMYSALRDGWAVDDKGQVINEEGLPMFDIHEELPEDDTPRVADKPKPTPATVPDKPARMGGYLIKKKGKQVIRPMVYPSSTPTPTPSQPQSDLPPADDTAKAPSAPPLAANDDSSFSDAFRKAKDEWQPDRSSTEAFFAQLEQEEAEEEAEQARLATEAAEKAPSSPESKGKGKAKDENSNGAIPLAVDTRQTATPTSNSFPKSKKSDNFLASFGAGFLTKAKPKPAPPPNPASTSRFTEVSGEQSDPPPLNTPKHHILPPPKSIYRPTPPPSAPSSRPASPRPDRKVAFDASVVGEGVEEAKPPKQKRAPIILGPPPSHDENGGEAPVPATLKKEPFQRPIKDTVVERSVKPPSAPKPRSTGPTTPRVPNPLSTVGRPPKSSNLPSRAVPSASNPSSVSSLPIHTLSLSSNSGPSRPGEVSASSLLQHPDSADDAEEAHPSLTSDGEGSDSDSSGFYGNEELSDEDDEDDDEVDIETALHMREVALEYHRQRMQVGAGVGTGPLGGDALPETYDSWNQPIVPIDANVQGRVPGTAASSRFRTGRLESAQMIIPSLLASHVKTGDPDALAADGDDDEDDDDLSPEERATLKTALERLANGGPIDDLWPSAQLGASAPPNPSSPVPTSTSASPRSTTSASPPSTTPAAQPTTLQPQRPTPSISALLGTTTGAEVIGQPLKQPPVVGRGTPIAVPRNPALPPSRSADLTRPKNAEEVGGQQQQQQEGGEEKPKKLSRFKARQMGLE